jgi:natural product precursor
LHLLVCAILKETKVKKVKKIKKLAIKKVTLQDLDEPKLNAVAGGYYTQPGATCGTCAAQTDCTCGIPCSARVCV